MTANVETSTALTVPGELWRIVRSAIEDHGLRLSAVAVAPQQMRRFHVTSPEVTKNKRNGALTRREMQVLALMAQGRSNKEIGALMGGLAEDTVKAHARALFKNLGARDRAHAVALGYQSGLLGGGS
jgi:ATP/maltotriose-dependent transcriptional regulator MalT